MIHTPKTCKDKVVVDVTGNEIPYVYEFNDETCEVKFYLKTKGKYVARAGESLEKGLDIVKCSVIMPGAKLVPRK